MSATPKHPLYPIMMGCEESKVTATTTTATATTTATTASAIIATAATATEWDPYSFCDGQVDWEAGEQPPFALVILNQAITNRDLFAALWKNCGLPSQSVLPSFAWGCRQLNCCGQHRCGSVPMAVQTGSTMLFVQMRESNM